jgi:hypothetical protein
MNDMIEENLQTEKRRGTRRKRERKRERVRRDKTRKKTIGSFTMWKPSMHIMR